MPGNLPVKIRSLTDIQAAYLAGLVDGEGTVTMTRKHKNEFRQLCVSISSTERPMLEFALSAIGAGKITNKRPCKSTHSPSYTFAVYNRQALALLEQISAHLKSYKRERARLILDKYLELTPRNGKYTTQILKQKEAFTNAVLAIKANSHL